MSKISVVIPVFNNNESLNELDEQLNHYLFEVDHEIIYVNDGSQDASLSTLQALKNQRAHVKILDLSRNFGQLNAVLCGFSNASGDAVITISADLQDDLSLLPKFIQHFNTGSEIVIARRSSRDDGIITNSFTKIIYNILKKKYNLPTGGFDYFLLSKRCMIEILKIRNKHMYLQGEILSLGFTTTIIDYARLKRKHGKSGWSLDKKLKLLMDIFLDGIIIKPRYIIILGGIFAISSLIYSLLVFLSYFIHGNPIQGWTSLMIALLSSTSIIIIMIGFVAEYIWRIYDNQKSDSKFIIKSEY